MSPEASSLEFVTFHVSIAMEAAVHPNQMLEHAEYLSMIQMMFASARLFHGDATGVVLTDEDTQFESTMGPGVQICRNEMDKRSLMLERTRAQLRYVQASRFERPVVILDSDILINSPLTPLLQQEFDVALTWRENDSMPINGGFLILNNTRPDVVKRFFARFADVYRTVYPDKAAWYGDQMALRDCLGLNLAEMRERSIVDVDGCRFLLLPCETYNFSPDNRYAEICTPLSDKVVLHFKGERKRLMEPFWRCWLSPRASCAPWAELSASRDRDSLRLQAEAEKQDNGEAEGEAG